MPRALLNLLAHIVVDLQVEDVSHKVQRILVVLDFGIQAGEIEAVCEVVLVDFAEVFVAAAGDELQ